MKIATFEIDFGLGSVDTFRGQFYDCLLYVEEKLSYSQRSVDVWSKRGKLLAQLRWCPAPKSTLDDCIADYGNFGYYDDWILNFGDYRSNSISTPMRDMDRGIINDIYLIYLDDTCTCYDLRCVGGSYCFTYRGIHYLTNRYGEGLFMSNYTHQIAGTCDFSVHGKSMCGIRAYINRWLNYHCLEV